MIMVNEKSLQFFTEKLKALKSDLPKVQVVLGSGFGEALNSLDPKAWQKIGEIPFGEVPGLTPSTVADHPGKYALYKHARGVVLFQMGRLHGYEGHPPRYTVQPVMIPRLCGVKKFILTNAAGGLDLKMKSGDVMMICDHINMTGTNPLVGANPKDVKGMDLGPRFPDMGDTYQNAWRNSLRKNLETQGLTVHEGCYMGLLGPTYETHAEVRLYASWGVKAVGMSTVWEAIALKHSGAELTGVSMISNLGAGLTPAVIDHQDIMGACRKSAGQIVAGLAGFMEAELLK